VYSIIQPTHHIHSDSPKAVRSGVIINYKFRADNIYIRAGLGQSLVTVRKSCIHAQTTSVFTICDICSCGGLPDSGRRTGYTHVCLAGSGISTVTHLQSTVNSQQPTATAALVLVSVIYISVCSRLGKECGHTQRFDHNDRHATIVCVSLKGTLSIHAYPNYHAHTLT
jgi:hypothetical protein